MEQTPLDPILAEFGQAPHLEEIQRAREQFFAALPDLREDDASFDRMMAFFLSWFVLDRPLDGSDETPLQRYAADPRRTEAEKELCVALSANRHSLFSVQKIRPGGVDLRDLFLNEPVAVTERRQLAGLRRGDILEARLFPREPGLVFVTGAFVVHPPAATPVIERIIDEHRNTGRPERRHILDRLRIGCFRFRDRYRERVDAARVYTEALEAKGSPAPSPGPG